MKHGALVLYIDNAGGGFHKLMTKEAENYNFESVFYKNHKHFVKPALQVRKFGYTPCFESRVSVHIWRKAFPKNSSCSLPSYSYNEQTFPPLSTIAIPPPKKYENQLHNEALTFNNGVSVPRTSAKSFSKFIGADHINLSQETSYAKNSTNTLFASDAKKEKASENSLGKSTEPQRKAYPKEILSEESVQYGISRNTINADFVSNQLHTKHKTSPATVSNVKNIKTFQYARDKSPESRMTTNRRKVVAEASLPSRNTSAPFRWIDSIRDIFCQELMGLITGEFIGLFQVNQINPITLGHPRSLGESFLFYLFESS
ncbi:hypothetical protein AVEN_265686-1 [Araneus ventricosus]|uniref:Uncharacterized protein n=1 Tax=Araneus ventricosus TaxID=182803 RepID=A0A4Y2K935_ARAVE|nr:hypothetical protein AVEN_265686-1 [Araneus ventricosus]